MYRPRVLRTLCTRRFNSDYRGSNSVLKKALGVSGIWREKSNKNTQNNLAFTYEDRNLSSLLKKLFKPNPAISGSLSKYQRQKRLSKLINDDDKFMNDELLQELPEQLDKPMVAARKADPSLNQNVSYWREGTKFDRQSYLKTFRDATPIVYWNCLDLTLDPSDFARLLPHPEMWVGSYENVEDIDLDFTVSRSRNPINLSRWLGYYLEFKSPKAAALYVTETRGAQLCGLEVNFKFVSRETAPGLLSPHLDKAPSVSRKMCAIVYGLPPEMNDNRISRILWDYELIDDDDLAITRLPKDNINYGGGPVLLRFKSEEEAQRFVREFHSKIWPHTDSEVIAEVVD
jgi:hypothetical protein